MELLQKRVETLEHNLRDAKPVHELVLFVSFNSFEISRLSVYLVEQRTQHVVDLWSIRRELVEEKAQIWNDLRALQLLLEGRLRKGLRVQFFRLRLTR